MRQGWNIGLIIGLVKSHAIPTVSRGYTFPGLPHLVWFSRVTARYAHCNALAPINLIMSSDMLDIHARCGHAPCVYNRTARLRCAAARADPPLPRPSVVPEPGWYSVSRCDKLYYKPKQKYYEIMGDHPHLTLVDPSVHSDLDQEFEPLPFYPSNLSSSCQHPSQPPPPHPPSALILP